MTFDIPDQWKDARIEDGQLVCPLCGGTYLHQGRVEVFERPEEDAQTGTHIAVTGHTTTVTHNAPMTANPSSRRHGMLIAFDCENCTTGTSPFVLAIVQHKGNTYTFWQPWVTGSVDA